MSGAALAFMICSWTFVLSLTAWCFTRVLRAGPPGSREPETNGARDPESGS